MRWGTTRSLPVQSNPLYAVESDDGLKVGYARIDTGVLKFSLSLDEGSSFAAETTPGITADDVPLDRPLVYDPLGNGGGGRWHLLYAQQVDSGALPCKLCYRHSDDNLATWSAEVVLDDGSTYGNNRFVRCGLTAYGDVIHVTYTSIDAVAFTGVGLFYRRSTDGGGSFSAKTEPWGASLNAVRPDAALAGNSVHIIWTQAFDVYYSRSLDKGVTWSSPSRWTTSGTCQRATISAESGDAVGVYQEILSGSFMTLLSRYSSDNGATFATAITVSSGSVADQEHSFLAQHGKYVGIVWTDWTTTPHSFRYKLSTDGGASWGTQETPFTSANNLAAGRIVGTKRGFLALCSNAESPSATNVLASRKALFLAPGGVTDAALAITDTFDFYATGTLLNAGGTPWTVGPNVANPIIGTGAAARYGSAGLGGEGAGFERDGSYRTADSIAGNWEAGLTLANSNNGEIDILIITTGRNGYVVLLGGGAFGGGLSLARYDAGVGTQLFNETSFAGSAVGDRTRMQLIGTQVIFYAYSTVASDWIEVGCPVDNTYRSALHGAIEITSLAGAPRADDYISGALSAPTNSSPAVLSGNPSLGSSISVLTGTWANFPDRYTYQWQRDGVSIADETLAFYVIQAADLGHTLTCSVTATNPVGSATATARAAWTGAYQ